MSQTQNKKQPHGISCGRLPHKFPCEMLSHGFFCERIAAEIAAHPDQYACGLQHDQRLLTKRRGTFGPFGNMCDNGCGALAVHNLLTLLGDGERFAEIVLRFNKSWFFSTWLGGLLGTNPHFACRYVEKLGYGAEYRYKIGAPGQGRWHGLGGLSGLPGLRGLRDRDGLCGRGDLRDKGGLRDRGDLRGRGDLCGRGDLPDRGGQNDGDGRGPWCDRRSRPNQAGGYEPLGQQAYLAVYLWRDSKGRIGAHYQALSRLEDGCLQSFNTPSRIYPDFDSFYQDAGAWAMLVGTFERKAKFWPENQYL